MNNIYRSDFEKFANSIGVPSTTLDKYERQLQNKLFMPMNSIVEPYILEERTLNVATMSVFSRLFYDRIIFLISEVEPDVANVIKAQLLYLNSTGEDDIKLYIDTPGGCVYSGLAIYDLMHIVEPDVATYNVGMAASMGSVLLSSGVKGKRYSIPHSRVMIHEIAYSHRGKYSDMKIEFEEAKKLQDELFTILSENTGKSFEQIEKDADRDKWFTSKEALEYGLIDEIVPFKK